jgi:hypothetical protein
MSASAHDFIHCTSTEERVLEALRARGPQTLEALAYFLTDASWSQVFLAIDRLSRVGMISLQPVRRCEYRVSLIKRAAA